jgi:hypothetical protein
LPKDKHQAGGDSASARRGSLHRIDHFRDVAFWHKADMTMPLSDVRFRGKADIGSTATMSANDPKRTLRSCERTAAAGESETGEVRVLLAEAFAPLLDEGRVSEINLYRASGLVPHLHAALVQVRQGLL